MCNDILWKGFWNDFGSDFENPFKFIVIWVIWSQIIAFKWFDFENHCFVVVLDLDFWKSSKYVILPISG